MTFNYNDEDTTMKHKPVDETQQSFATLSGLGIFKVIGASEGISSAGNEMIKLELYCIDENGNSKVIKDHIVGTEKAEWRTKQLFICINRMDIYDKEEIKIDDVLQQKGACTFKQEENEYNGKVYTNSKIDNYLDRAAVVLPDDLSFDLLEAKKKDEAKENDQSYDLANDDELLNEDIPF